MTTAKNFGPTIFLLTKIKSEYSDILNNMTHPPGPLVCRVRQVPQEGTIVSLDTKLTMTVARQIRANLLLSRLDLDPYNTCIRMYSKSVKSSI